MNYKLFTLLTLSLLTSAASVHAMQQPGLGELNFLIGLAELATAAPTFQDAVAATTSIRSAYTAPVLQDAVAVSTSINSASTAQVAPGAADQLSASSGSAGHGTKRVRGAGASSLSNGDDSDYPTSSADDSDYDEAPPAKRAKTDAPSTKRIDCNYLGCGKSLASKQTLAMHMRRHTHPGEKPFACNHPGCDKRYAHTASLYTHKVRIHKLAA